MKERRLVLVKWEHPTTAGRLNSTRIYLGESESAAHKIAEAQGLSDRVKIHSITPLPEGPNDYVGP